MLPLESIPEDHKSDDLALTAEEFSAAPVFEDQRHETWPFPPNYAVHETVEMRNLAPQPDVNQERPPPGPPDPPRGEPFNFSFFKPKKDGRRKYIISLMIFLIALIVILATVFGVYAREKRAGPVAQNFTVSTTISTALISTEMVSTSLTKTYITTRPTTLTKSTTSVQSTTLVGSTTVVQPATLIQPTTLTQVTTCIQVSVTTQIDISTQISTLPITFIQSTIATQTTTATTTSLLPNPTSVAKCWALLTNICSNATTVPQDTSTGDFGDCVQVFSVFYCGLIQDFENKHIFIIPADESPICGGMRNFCAGVGLETGG